MDSDYSSWEADDETSEREELGSQPSKGKRFTHRRGQVEVNSTVENRQLAIPGRNFGFGSVTPASALANMQRGHPNWNFVGNAMSGFPAGGWDGSGFSLANFYQGNPSDYGQGGVNFNSHFATPGSYDICLRLNADVNLRINGIPNQTGQAPTFRGNPVAASAGHRGPFQSPSSMLVNTSLDTTGPVVRTLPPVSPPTFASLRQHQELFPENGWPQAALAYRERQPSNNSSMDVGRSPRASLSDHSLSVGSSIASSSGYGSYSSGSSLSGIGNEDVVDIYDGGRQLIQPANPLWANNN